VKDAEVMEMAKHDLQVVLVGRKEEIEKVLSTAGDYPKSPSPSWTPGSRGNGRKPGPGLQTKAGFFHRTLHELVKRKEVDACCSAGNSGLLWPRP